MSKNRTAKGRSSVEAGSQSADQVQIVEMNHIESADNFNIDIVENALRERVKELNCLYGISKLIDRSDISIDHLMQGTVDLLPPSWQYPDYTCSRIIFERKEYKSPGFKVSRYRQTADISVEGDVAGTVEVYYIKKMPVLDEGPFLKEERDLINSVAETLGRFIEKIRIQKELIRTYDELRVERRALKESNVALREVLSRIQDEKKDLKEAILANVDKIVMPILFALEANVDHKTKGYVRLIKRNLEEITSPLIDRISRKFMTLTPAELKTCNMIRLGLTSKEIAEIRHVSTATVYRQRESIRRKLNLTGKSVNMVTYLQTYGASDPPMNRIDRLKLNEKHGNRLIGKEIGPREEYLLDKKIEI